jgi:hypothetical protein
MIQRLCLANVLERLGQVSDSEKKRERVEGTREVMLRSFQL